MSRDTEYFSMYKLMYVNSELVQYREKDALTWCGASAPVVSVAFFHCR